MQDRPSDKVTAATIAAAVGAILTWALETYGGVVLPPPVQLAAITILTLLVGYVMPESRPSSSAIAHAAEQAEPPSLPRG